MRIIGFFMMDCGQATVLKQAEAAVCGFCDALPGDIFDLSGYDGEIAEAELTALRYIFTAEGEETQLKLTAKKKEEM